MYSTGPGPIFSILSLAMFLQKMHIKTGFDSWKEKNKMVGVIYCDLLTYLTMPLNVKEAFKHTRNYTLPL